MIQFIDGKLQGKECCGCSACCNACPKKCIAMQETEEGFLYPSIDISECIQCGLCENSCPIINQPSQSELRKMYGGHHKDESIVAQSSSGGAFYLFASYIVEHGGVVAGVTMDKNYHVKHILADKKEQLSKVFGSKYVQSEISDIYVKIKRILKEGRQVLFTGSPCQVAGIRTYLGNVQYTDKLFTMEFICHGVPSPRIWEDHMKYLSTLHGVHLENVSFRSKQRRGWHDFEFYFEAEQKPYYYGVRQDIFYNGFLENLFLRPACYECQFKGTKSSADISVADFWGSEVYASDMLHTNDKGLSLVAIFTEQGERLFDLVQSEFECCEIEDRRAYTSNTASMTPAAKNGNTKKFYSYRQKYGTEQALQKYATYTTRKMISNKVKWKIQAIIKKIKRV